MNKHQRVILDALATARAQNEFQVRAFKTGSRPGILRDQLLLEHRERDEAIEAAMDWVKAQPTS